MKKANEILAIYADELDRHYVSPNKPQIIYLSEKDWEEFEKEWKEHEEKFSMTVIRFDKDVNIKVKNEDGSEKTIPVKLPQPNPSSQYTHPDLITFISFGGYSFPILKSETSSLLYTAIRNS